MTTLRRPLFRCTLPLPPSVNEWLVPTLVPVPPGPGTEKLIRARMAVRGADGRVWATRLQKSKVATKWIEHARAQLAAMPRPASFRVGVLELEMTVYVPSLASDGGNRLKLPEDGFKELVIDDDRQFVRWVIVKDIDADNPRAELVVRHADAAAHPRVAERLARAEREKPKREARERAKRAQETLPLAPTWKTPLPAGTSPGVPSYGSRHATELKPAARGSLRKVGQALRGLATSASHRPGRTR